MFDSFMKAWQQSGTLAQLEPMAQQITAQEAPNLVQPPQLYNQPGPPQEGFPSLYGHSVNTESLNPRQWVAFNQQRQQKLQQFWENQPRDMPSISSAPADPAHIETPRDPFGYPTLNPRANEGLIDMPKVSKGFFFTQAYNG